MMKPGEASLSRAQGFAKSCGLNILAFALSHTLCFSTNMSFLIGFYIATVVVILTTVLARWVSRNAYIAGLY